VILVAGAGFLGGRLLADLAADGVPCIGLTLSADRAAELEASLGIRVLAADLGDAGALRGALDQLEERPDRVFHCASSNRGGAEAYRRVFVEGTRHLIELIQPERFLFSSSTSVYRQTDGSRVDEGSPTEPKAETGRLLLEGEALAAGAKSHGILRLGGLYGPGRAFVLQRLLEGRATIDHPPEGGRWLNQIHVADAASAARFLLQHEACGVFNVVDGNAYQQTEVYEKIAPRFGVPLPAQAEPRLDGKRGWTHKEVMADRLRALGWKPKFPDWLSALDADPELVPSILKRVG